MNQTNGMSEIDKPNRLSESDAGKASSSLQELGDWAADHSPESVEKALSGLDALKLLEHRNIGPNVSHPKQTELHHQQIGRFNIIRQLGRGGHGSVYLAFDPRLHRKVAIKIPSLGSLACDQMRVRFKRESKAAAMLAHPAIVPIHEFCEFGPYQYIVYKYIPGVSLAKYLDDHHVSHDPVLVASIVANVAEAVEHAHQRGVVHRDLKPGNLLVEFDEPPAEQHTLPNRIRIADFGLAKILNDREESLTGTHEFVGTLAYVAPEKLDRDPGDGIAGDIYSIGIILYELLTGSPPFVADSEIRMLQLIAKSNPESPRSLNSKISNDLAAICLKCLEKHPEDRYSSAHLLSQDLKAFAAGDSISIRPPSIASTLGKLVQRNPTATYTMLLFLLLTFVIGGVAMYSIYHARNRELDALRLAQTSLSQTRTSIRDFFLTTQQEIAGLPGDSKVRKVLVNKSIQLLEALQSSSGDIESNRLLAECRYLLGTILERNGRLEEASEMYRNAETTFALQVNAERGRPSESDSYHLAACQLAIARVDLEFGNVPNAAKRLDSVAQRLEETEISRSRLHELSLESIYQQVRLQNLSGEHRGAMETGSAFLERLDHDADTIGKAKILRECSYSASCVGEFRRARSFSESAKKLLEDLDASGQLYPGDRWLALSVNARVQWLNAIETGSMDLNSIEKLITSCRDAVDRNPDYASNKTELAIALATRGTYFQEKQNWSGSIQSLQEAIHILELGWSDNRSAKPYFHILRGAFYHDLACNLVELGNEQAADYFQFAVQSSETVLRLVTNEPIAAAQLVKHHHQLARIYRSKSPDKARQQLRKLENVLKFHSKAYNLLSDATRRDIVNCVRQVEKDLPPAETRDRDTFDSLILLLGRGRQR